MYDSQENGGQLRSPKFHLIFTMKFSHNLGANLVEYRGVVLVKSEGVGCLLVLIYKNNARTR